MVLPVPAISSTSEMDVQQTAHWPQSHGGLMTDTNDRTTSTQSWWQQFPQLWTPSGAFLVDEAAAGSATEVECSADLDAFDSALDVLFRGSVLREEYDQARLSSTRIPHFRQFLNWDCGE
jgi:hypothetical protein